MDRAENIRRLKEEAGRPKIKEPYRIPKKSKKKLQQEAELKKANSLEGREESLNEWFQRIEDKHWGKQDLDMDGFDHEESEVELPRCQECGSKIPREYARHATAHLLAKKIFKSIATNDLNYILLCASNGCHNKTHTLSTFVTMRVWPLAAKNINALLPLLPYDELKFVSAQLYQALENY